MTSYIQYIFRAGSPGKDTFYSFDFCTERILDVADQFAQVRATKHNTSYDSEIAKVLNYLPLFAYNGVGGWESLETKNFFNSISKFSTIRATSNLIKDYLLELVEYENELADVEVGSLNPQTSHNAEIGKLKKELLKKAKKSSKTEKESSSKDLVEKLFQAFIDIYTFVKFANNGVENLDDFIKKLNTYDGECEDYFGFSDDFIKTLIAVMNSEKRSFEIAIQRFKHIDLKFAMEDVPDELAKRMIQKLDLKKGDTVCDWCCKGVGLLKNIPSGHKLYAKVDDKRTELIVKKLLPNVNIVKDMTMNFDHIIMNPPYTTKVEKGRKRSLDLDFPIYKEACKHSDDVVCLMRRSQKYKKDGEYTGYQEDDIIFEGVNVEVAIFEHRRGLPTLKIKSKYELNGKLDWIKQNDLTSKTTTLWHLIDRDWDKFKLGEPVPKGYVALNEVSTKNFTVFTEGEVPLKKNGEPLRMLVYIKTKDSQKMKKWLIEYVNPLHNVFRRFGDNNIDRGFTRTIEVPEDLIRR